MRRRTDTYEKITDYLLANPDKWSQADSIADFMPITDEIRKLPDLPVTTRSNRKKTAVIVWELAQMLRGEVVIGHLNYYAKRKLFKKYAPQLLEDI